MSWTIEQQAKRSTKGFGSGEGISYVPWLGLRDVSSIGYRTRIKGRVVERMHVFFSMLERSAFLAAQRLPWIYDIREQFPLPLEETNLIASRQGIRPPRHRKNPVVVTTDMVLYFRRNGHEWREAVSVKPFSKLADRRTSELLRLERAWWEDRGEPWRLVTNQELPRAIIANLEWIDEHHVILPGSFHNSSVDQIASNLLPRLRIGIRPLFEVCAQTDSDLGIDPGSALMVFRHMLSRRLWGVPMHTRIDTTVILDPTSLIVASVGHFLVEASLF